MLTDIPVEQAAEQLMPAGQLQEAVLKQPHTIPLMAGGFIVNRKMSLPGAEREETERFRDIHGIVDKQAFEILNVNQDLTMRMDVGIAGVGCPMRIALVIELKITGTVGMVEKNIPGFTPKLVSF